jgi:hypothetical protein
MSTDCFDVPSDISGKYMEATFRNGVGSPESLAVREKYAKVKGFLKFADAVDQLKQDVHSEVFQYEGKVIAVDEEDGGRALIATITGDHTDVFFRFQSEAHPGEPGSHTTFNKVGLKVGDNVSITMRKRVG